MKKIFSWILACTFSITAVAQPAAMLVNLQTEHLTSPLGIDAAQPRFSWEAAYGQLGADPRAYTVTVGVDSGKAALGQGMWESSRRTGAVQLVTYEGPRLKPFTCYYWSVTCWDHTGRTIHGPVAKFETGMMEMVNWRGSWITDTRDIHLKPAAYFRKTFRLEKTIVSARAYIAAAGLYELYINGKKVGDHVLDPMYTRFDRRNLYVTYDVSNELKNGANTIGVLLGNGWYNLQSTAVWYFDKAPWRNRPSFCMDIRVTYSDGSVETISSGKDWKTTLSPIVFNSIYTAEHYDARLEMPHWNEPSYNDSAWHKVFYTPAPSQTIVAQAMAPIRREEQMVAAGFRKFSDTDYVFDLGRNIAGVSQITLQGDAGTVIRLKHGERLYADGHVDLSNIDVHYRPTDDSDPFQTDIYILKGGEPESFVPHFNYKGFQYVEVTGSQPIQLDRHSLIAYFMHSDVQPVGTIHTSDSVVNKIWRAANNSYLSNLYGYPTDCPQREKNGWTGDAQIAVETGLYNFDAITVYEKWLADLRDEQQPNGVLPSIVPTDGWGYEWGNGPDWTSAIAVIPWEVYLFYGDPKMLADSYDNIKRYVEHIRQLYPSGLCSWGLGDWVPVNSRASVELTSTAYYYADVHILANAAKLFGKQADYQTYCRLAGEIKDAFNAKYLDRAIGTYGKGIQTEQSVPLYWGLAPDSMKAKIAARLAERVIADSVKLDVGLLGTKAILNALSENGYAGLAYRLASSRTFPSWGYWIVNGATTLYENWPLDSKRDISMNHIMFGEIGAWFYKGLGGILPDPAAPGFRHILLRPSIVPGLDSFTAIHRGPYGEISSGWTHEGGRLVYTAVIPPGSFATLSLAGPGQQKPRIETLKAGRYVFAFDEGARRFGPGSAAP